MESYRSVVDFDKTTLAATFLIFVESPNRKYTLRSVYIVRDKQNSELRDKVALTESLTNGNTLLVSFTNHVTLLGRRM